MEDRILKEINRFREICDLPLLTEQITWLDNLISAGKKRFSSLDDVISKLGYKKVDLTDNEIDDIADELKLAGLTDDMAENVRNILKNDANVRKALTTPSTDFVTALKNASKSGKKISGFDVVKTFNPAQIKSITKGLVTKFLNDPTSNLSKSLVNLDTSISGVLQKIYDNNQILNSVDEMYDVFDGFINRLLSENGFSDDLAEEVLQSFKTKYRSSSKTKELLDKFKSEGRTLNKPSRVKSVSKYDNTNLLSDDWLSAKKWKALDDNGTPIQHKTTPVDVDPLNTVVNDDVIPPLNLDGWGPMIDESGKFGSKWSDNFFFRYCKMGFCEAIIDFIRSIGRSPEDFVKDTIDTLNKIDELFKKYSSMNPGDSGYVSLKKELDGYVNRLKSNAKMLQKGNVGFETTWKSIESNIRKTLSKDGDPSYANEFINYIKNKAVTSGGETIGEFIDLMKSYYTKKSGSIELVNLFEMFTPEFWRNWKETKALKYAEDVKAVFNRDPKNGAIFGRIANTVGKVAWDIAWNGLKRAANFLTIGTFRYYDDILKRLKTGKFTDWKGLTNYGLLYIELVIITNVMDPIFEFIGDWYDSYQEINLISDVGSDPRTPFEKLKDNFASKINIFGNEFDWVPFYNPIPKTDGTYLGLKPAPLPNYLTDKLIGWVNSLIEPATTNTTGDVIENRKTKLLEQINPQIAELNKELQAEWDSATPKEKEEIKEKNGYYKDYYDILKFTYDDEIEPSYLKMILDSLEYNPKVSSDTVMKMVDMEKGDFSKVTEYTKLLKDSKTAIADVKGFMTIKDKGGRKYRIIMKPSNDELYYIEPSIDVLDKDPRTKIQQKNIKDFVNKLK